MTFGKIDSPGTIFLVATPIGNLQDITFRAIETLKNVDLIACEDTRQTRKLLSAHDISNQLVSYHQHNEQERAAEFQKMLLAGKNIAIVTDAGTPGIADPAFRAVGAAIEINAPVVAIPGAAAFVNALIVSGLPSDAHFFGGFLPSKTGERRKRLLEVAGIPATLIFYETPHRLVKSLKDCADVLGNRLAVVARELTKMYEEIVRGNLKQLIDKYETAENIRGEIVLLISRATLSNLESEIQNPKSLLSRVAELEAAGLDNRAALKQAAKDLGLPRAEAYRRLLAEKNF